MPIQIWGDYECKYVGNSHRDANTPVTCGICGIRPQPPTLHWRDNDNVTIFSRTLGFHLSLSLGFASKKMSKIDHDSKIFLKYTTPRARKGVSLV